MCGKVFLQKLSKGGKMKNVIRLFLLLMILTVFCSFCSRMDLTPEEQEYLSNVKRTSLKFTINEEDIVTVWWTRTQSFLGQYCHKQIVKINEEIIETEEPKNRKDGYGYIITKKNDGGKFNIKVVCITKNSMNDDFANRNAHILAYYMQTGELSCPDLIKQ